MSAMNPPSPAQTARPGPTGNGDTIPALRNTCDACASAKLRCPKEKPTCRRCAKRGITCEYFAIKRAGRKPGSRTGVNANAPAPIPPMEPPCPPERIQSPPEAAVSSPADKFNEQVLMWDQLHPDFMDMDTLSVDGLFTTDKPEFDLFNPADLLSIHIDEIGGGGGGGSGSGSSSSSTSGSTNGAGSDATGDVRPRLESFSTTLSGLGVTVDELLPFTNPDSAEWTSFAPLEATGASCSCLAEAAGFITRLSQLSSTVRAIWASVDLDDATVRQLALNVVKQNQVTINAVGAILQCPNFHDGTLLALISFIIFKILSLYAAMACKDPNLQNLPSATTHPAASQAEAAFLTQSLGDDYSMETGDPLHMAGRIVLGELHRVRHLIAQLIDRLNLQFVMQEQETQEAGDPQQSMDLDCEMRLPLSTVMCEQLDADLRRRLKALSWAIVDRMTRLR